MKNLSIRKSRGFLGGGLIVGGLVLGGVIVVAAAGINADAGLSSGGEDSAGMCYTRCNWFGTWNCENDIKVGGSCALPTNCSVAAATNFGAHACITTVEPRN